MAGGRRIMGDNDGKQGRRRDCGGAAAHVGLSLCNRDRTQVSKGKAQWNGDR